MGAYHQVSDNWHAYVDVLTPLLPLRQATWEPPGLKPPNPYAQQVVAPYPMVNRTKHLAWLQDLDMFLDQGTAAIGYHDIFFRRVALPMLVTHDIFSQLSGAERYLKAAAAAEKIAATDWRLAVQNWIALRYNRFLKKQEEESNDG
jgi:hypothetical protein